MGTITPNSNIILLQGVPLNNDYNETVFWSTAQGVAGQAAGIMAYPHITITNKSYQRVGEGILRVNLLADSIYNYNYMMFKNIGTVTGSAASAGYVDKWFYAFITNIEYVNERACNVFYEIDEIQTWFFDAILEPSFVEREHSATDAIGEHTLAEPIDCGNIICTDLISADSTGYGFINYKIVCFEVADSTPPEDPQENEENNVRAAEGEHTGYLIDGIYSGLVPHVYDASISGTGTLNSDIQDLIDSSTIDRIVSIVVVPEALCHGFNKSDTVFNSTPIEFSISRPNTVDGYTPRNNKLLTAPYIFFYIDVQTDSHPYRYEYFENPSNCRFYGQPCLSPTPEIAVVPMHYNGSKAVSYHQQYNVDESVIMDGFPQGSVAVDAYRAYLAQKSTDYAFKQAGNAVTIGGSAITAGAGVATLNPAALAIGGVGLLQGIIGSAQASYDNAVEQNKGSSTRGTHGSSATLKFRDINIRYMSIRAETARMIDDYFTRYGYVCQRIKVPNRNVRQSWTYTKTTDIAIQGNIPSNSMAKIKSIYNKGISFFRSLANVGNYGLSNNIG